MDREAASSLQDGYDQVAADYAKQLFNELDQKPFDRHLLDLLISEVRGRGPVIDLGCGPGEVARYLYDQGLEQVAGIDLSPAMVRQAQQCSPMIPFQTGNMLSLDVPADSWAGIAAFYSIIHIPRTQVVDVLVELKRVLVPGGVLLLAFHINVGQGEVHVNQFFNKTVSIDFVFFQVQEMRKYLKKAGFTRIEVFERPPYPDIEYQGPRAYIFARKPETPHTF
jgi:SAM-dependent methyltransferase